MMKRFFAAILAAAMLLACAPAMAMPGLNNADSFTANVEFLLKIAPEQGYKVQQGAATDGEYAYLILENQDEDLCSLWKVEMENWTVVDSAFGLALDHGNDLTYNPNTDRLIAVHNAPHYSWLSIIHPDTLEVEQTLVTSSGMSGIAYCPERNQYAIGLAGTYHTAILDSEFKYLSKIKGQDTGLTRQGIECDENYIYHPQWDRLNGGNVIMVYDWEGNFVNRIPVEDNGLEIEAMFHVGEDYYAAFYGAGSTTCKLTLSKAE